jgi:UDP-N-acetyl-D-mannosaminuronic acid dehydrogenase
MGLAELKQRIKDKQARIAVIGLGYVGLPVSASFAQEGFDVVGVDLIKERVEKINHGENPIEGDEPGLQELLSKVITTGKLKATTDYTELKDREIVLIDVETPVDEKHKPRYEALRACLNSLGKVMADGTLVIVESTISPGTMSDLVQPLLEQSSGKKSGIGFYLGNCPERVMPGKLLLNLRTLSRVVGGMSPATAETMVALYRHIVEGDLDPTDCVTAELVKTVENAYRDVQIAFANEVALISEAVGGDVWKVRELVNKSPGRNMLLPGAGVGGHCIPKDPWLLASAVEGKDVPLRLIPAARAVNDGMPGHMVELVKKALTDMGKELKGARILVMGYAYLENSDDTRNSPSAALVEELKAEGATAVIHDPFVKEYQGDQLEMAKGCDAAVLMVKHEEYQSFDLSNLIKRLRHPFLIDGRGMLKGNKDLEAKAYVGLGIGKRH